VVSGTYDCQLVLLTKLTAVLNDRSGATAEKPSGRGHGKKRPAKALVENVRFAPAESDGILPDDVIEDVKRARLVLTSHWPFLASEPDITDGDREHAAQLEDILDRETFFRDLPELGQHTRALEQSFEARRTAAIENRCAEYDKALSSLKGTPGWEQLDAEQQEQISSTLRSRANADGADSMTIPLLREQIEACPRLLSKVTEEMLRMIDGNRVEPLEVAGYFAGGIETEEQLEAALDGLRERVRELIAAGKKVFIQ